MKPLQNHLREGRNFRNCIFLLLVLQMRNCVPKSLRESLDWKKKALWKNGKDALRGRSTWSLGSPLSTPNHFRMPLWLAERLGVVLVVDFRCLWLWDTYISVKTDHDWKSDPSLGILIMLKRALLREEFAKKAAFLWHKPPLSPFLVSFRHFLSAVCYFEGQR